MSEEVRIKVGKYVYWLDGEGDWNLVAEDGSLYDPKAGDIDELLHHVDSLLSRIARLEGVTEKIRIALDERTKRYGHNSFTDKLAAALLEQEGEDEV